MTSSFIDEELILTYLKKFKMKLKHWYQINYTKPLLYSLSSIVVLIFVFNTFQIYTELKQKERALDEIVELVTLGLNQKNRVLVEATLNLAINNLDLNQVTLCEDGNPVFSHPNPQENCETKSKPFLLSEIRKRSSGLQGYEMIFTFSWLKHLSLFLYSILLLTLISSLFSFLASKLKSKFFVDLLNPLHPNSTTLSPIKEIQHIVFQRKELEEYKVKSAVGEALSSMAEQVSHDIRSPLSALNLLLGSLSQLPESHRLIMRNATQRINDIANDLLNHKQSLPVSNSKEKIINNFQELNKIPELIPPIIESIISEKRIQFREKQDIEILSDLNKSYGAFIFINPIELKRVLSNLLNNSIEAFNDNQGSVTVALRQYGENIAIIIQDNGRGIPEEILNQLGEKGVSYGKSELDNSGSGLGIYHAKKVVESFNGQFLIQSREGIGTTITMTFKKADPPSWFVKKIYFNSNQIIVSVDDDYTIHQIWQSRIETSDKIKQISQYITFTSIQEFKNWYLKNKQELDLNSSPILFLIDYEFLNQKMTGLDLIEELNIISSSILVTSRFDESTIKNRCIKLGLKLIPKSMAAIVPIEYSK